MKTFQRPKRSETEVIGRDMQAYQSIDLQNGQVNAHTRIDQQIPPHLVSMTYLDTTYAVERTEQCPH